MKEQFRDGLHLHKSNIEKLEIVNSIIDDYLADGYRLTLRQLYYQLVVRNVIPNIQKEYAKLSGLLVKGRMAGEVDWNAIEDRIRIPYLPYWARGISDAIEDITNQYRLDRQEGQDNYIELFCFPEDTSIIMKNKIKNIFDIKKGDLVLTKEGNFQKVTNLFSRNYKGKLNNIQAVGLLNLRSTPNHKYFIKPYDDKVKSYKGKFKKYGDLDFVAADKIKRFDFLLVPRLKKVRDILAFDMKASNRSKYLTGVLLDEDLCKVIGLYLAEGCIKGGRTVQFTFDKRKKEYSKIVFEWAERIGFNPWQAFGPGVNIVFVSSKAFSLWLEENFGKGAYNKFFPKWLLSLPFEKQMMIMKYYFFGDGTIEKDSSCLSISTKSKMLALQSQIIFIRNGFGCSVRAFKDRIGIRYRIGISGKFGHDLAKKWNLKLPRKKRRFNHIRIDDDYAYFPVIKNEVENFQGKVYNVEVKKSHTYCLPCIVHNCEKDALSNVLKRVTSYYHIHLLINRGYSSCSAMYDAYNRLMKATERGQEPYILYLGDHDPSGLDMVRDIEERLCLDFRIKVEVRHIALTSPQIKKHNLPPNPAKFSDPRAKWYIRKFGKTSWEVDALNPKTLNTIVEMEIEDLIDMKQFRAQLNKEKEHIEVLQKFGKKFK